MAVQSSPAQCLVARQLSLPDGRTLPPSIPLIISSQDNWNPLSCQLETSKHDPNDHTLKLVKEAVELLHSIDEPLAVLSICGPYRSGKSYFISRLLGSPGAFKLGHSMQACTRGIWMATTVLECQDFATVLLDTEGIDAVGVSETFAMSLLTLTTLLSSFLIYNSKKVPQKVDLSKMRCFSQLSTSLLAQCGETLSTDAKKAFFPQFLWLLRDVALKMTDREGKKLEPTDFLHSRVLASESGKLTDLGKSLVGLFPSLECATLPIPSIKRDIIRGIVEQQDKLKPAFNAAVDALIEDILLKVSPKKAVDGTTAVNGKALAALAEGYVEAINTPGALPDLDQGWQAVVKLELKECSYKLVREYEAEMEEALQGNLPMEERNLLRIHQQTLNGKKGVLREDICRVDPLHSSDDDTKPLLDQLERDIVQWSEPSSDGERKVSGGALYRFTTENFAASKEFCENVFADFVRNTEVHKKVQKAVKDSLPLDLHKEVSEITEEYNSRAVGPAASQVLERELSELSQLSNILKKIPGCPQNVKVIGRGSDRIKLSWDPPEHNPEAVEEYVVYKRIEGGEWEEGVRTKKTKALVKGLKSNAKPQFDSDHISMDAESTTEYAFQVMAINSTVTSLAGRDSSTTRDSKAATTAMGVLAGICSSFFLPFTIGTAQEAFKDEELSNVSEDKLGFLACLSIVSFPVSVALAPITAPVLTLGMVIHLRKNFKKDEGDLSEDSD